jgi:lipoate-protein ligase B
MSSNNPFDTAHRTPSAFLCHTPLLTYAQAWSLQQKLAIACQTNALPDTLLLCEHPPTYTCGRSTQAYHLPAETGPLEHQGFAVHHIERGGSVTYHGPGQLIGYPIVDLRRQGRDVHRHIRRLEQALIQTLAVFGLTADARPGLTGVWIGPRKIAAIGIYVRRWITMHGFALNISLDLEPFTRIRPCGLDSKVVTSMAKLLSTPPAMDQVAAEIAKRMAELFSWTLQEIPFETLMQDLDHIALND